MSEFSGHCNPKYPSTSSGPAQSSFRRFESLTPVNGAEWVLRSTHAAFRIGTGGSFFVGQVSLEYFVVLTRKILAGAPLLFMAASAARAQSFSPVQTKTLDGVPVVLSGEGRTKPLLLLLGFSHKSDDDFKKWAERARTPCVSDSRIDYYEMVDLQGIL